MSLTTPEKHSKPHLQVSLQEPRVGPGGVHEGAEARLEVRVAGLVLHLVVVLPLALGVDVELLQVEAAVHVRKDPSPDAILE